MRHIHSNIISKKTAQLCLTSNLTLPNDLIDTIKISYENEEDTLAKEILSDMLKNASMAKQLKIPICQDTGMVVCFLDIGQDVHILGDTPKEAVNKGVRLAYKDSVLRNSVVKDPFDRVNTEDNTPAIVYINIVKGNQIKLTVAPKGFGSENMSALKMFNPSAQVEDVTSFILDTVQNAGGKACPPMVVGIGIGGDFEMSALLSKKALCRPISERNSDPFYLKMEEDLLARLNELDIGPQGFGGKTSVLAVNIEQYPTHIAGLPVAVNIGCHVTRHKNIII